MEYLVANLSGTAKRYTLDGIRYLVAPITLIRQGVLNGSQGPILYELDDIEESVDAWNGMPILLGHPETGLTAADVVDEQGVGLLLAPKVSNERLVAQGLFEIEKLKRLDPELLTRIRAGKKIEVSTGLRISAEDASGVDERGRQYNRIARNYRPDHLAVLVGQVGACAIVDGCGINNESVRDFVNPFMEIEMCTCAKGAADQSDLLGLPTMNFANPLAGMESANSVGRDDDLLGLPVMNFANPLLKPKPAVANRSHVRAEDEPVGELPWHFANPLR